MWVNKEDIYHLDSEIKRLDKMISDLIREGSFQKIKERSSSGGSPEQQALMTREDITLLSKYPTEPVRYLYEYFKLGRPYHVRNITKCSHLGLCELPITGYSVYLTDQGSEVMEAAEKFFSGGQANVHK